MSLNNNRVNFTTSTTKVADSTVSATRNRDRNMSLNNGRVNFTTSTTKPADSMKRWHCCLAKVKRLGEHPFENDPRRGLGGVRGVGPTAAE